tara:strand:+ start:106692 stop:108128 length:1437 start_codon:yes stop_codon:yes gene_type:complete
MIHQKKIFHSLLLLSASVFGLMSCTPAFETTAEECVTFSPVTLTKIKTSDNTEFQTLADRPTNDYKLYLEDALNSLKDIKSKASDGSTTALSADEQTAIQFILDKANEKMGYTLENGIVTSASNPLDYLESLIAATDVDEIIQTFVDAKQNVAQAISKDDSVCNYRNSAIKIFVEDPDLPSNDNIVKTVNAQLNISYSAFNEESNKNVDQTILISLDEPIDDLDLDERSAKSFAGISRIAGKDFKASGVSPSEVRQVNISDSETNETFFFDDDFDELKLGQMVNTLFNKACTDDEGNRTTCPDTVTTRISQHDECDGGLDSNDEEQTDETNQIQVNNFTLVEGNPALENIQRLRLEVDYPNDEIRMYASKYAEAVLRADVLDPAAPTADEIIYNPTACEQQAVLDDLLDLIPEEEKTSPSFEGVRLTFVEDPNYDLIEILDANGDSALDDDGNKTYIEPTAIFTFYAPEIPSGRQALN